MVFVDIAFSDDGEFLETLAMPDRQPLNFQGHRFSVSQHLFVSDDLPLGVVLGIDNQGLIVCLDFHDSS